MRVQPGHQGLNRMYNPTIHKVVERRNAVFVETPSREVSPSINEPDNIENMDNVGSIIIRRWTRGRRHATRRARLHIAHQLQQRRDVRPHNPNHATARPGDSRDPDKNPRISSSGCAGRRRVTGSTGGQHQRPIITGGKRRRTATDGRR